MKKQIKPLFDKVVVKADSAEEITKGGIIIPDTAREKPLTGTVFASGPDSVVKKGDRILYGRYAGTELNVHGEDVLLMTDRDIYSTI